MTDKLVFSMKQLINMEHCAKEDIVYNRCKICHDTVITHFLEDETLNCDKKPVDLAFYHSDLCNVCNDDPEHLAEYYNYKTYPKPVDWSNELRDDYDPNIIRMDNTNIIAEVKYAFFKDVKTVARIFISREYLTSLLLEMEDDNLTLKIVKTKVKKELLLTVSESNHAYIIAPLITGLESMEEKNNGSEF